MHASGEKHQYAGGILDIPNLKPGESASIPVHSIYPTDEDIGQWEDWLTISFTQRDDTEWAPEGHEIAWEQFLLRTNTTNGYETSFSVDQPQVSDSEETMKLDISESSTTITIKDDSEHTLIFDKIHARIRTWTKGDISIFKNQNGPELTFWRAPTDNDRPVDLLIWRNFGLDVMTEQVRSVTLNHTSSSQHEITVISYFSPPVLGWGFNTTTTYSIQSLEDISINIHAIPTGPIPPTLPRIGLEMELDSRFGPVSWYGLGPGENYRDSCSAAKMGIWNSSLQDLNSIPNVPQEWGNRMGTRWLQISDDSGINLLATLTRKKGGDWKGEAAKLGGFEWSFNTCSAEEVENASHPCDLKGDEAILRLDAAHRGLGTGSCGPGVREGYELKTEEFEFEVTLKILEREENFEIVKKEDIVDAVGK